MTAHETHLICKCLAGSRSYGLNTESSDYDYRGVYINSNVGHVLGLGKESQAKTEKNVEENTEGTYFEVRHFMGLLRKTNTMVMEILFSENWVAKAPAFDLILDNKFELLDTEKFYKSLRGYMLNESRLAFGERTGKLGSLRKTALDKYGYSPKNIVNLLRLCAAGSTFFQTGVFPVKIEAGRLRDLLLDIRQRPDNHTVEQLGKAITVALNLFELHYEERKTTYVFNENVANEILFELYKPYLNKYETNL